MRKMLPGFRKKSSIDRSNVIAGDVFEDNNDVQMYDNGYWRDTGADRRPGHDDFRSETPYMSGALPVEQSFHVSDPRESQLLPSMGFYDNRSDFTFRASSPVKLDKQGNSDRPVHLPTERSYIRLMDGLSSDSGVELGLKDPRKQPNTIDRGNGENRQVLHGFLNEDNLQGVDYEKRWDLGHPFMHQSPFRSSTSTDVHGYLPSHHQTNGFTNRVHNVLKESILTHLIATRLCLKTSGTPVPSCERQHQAILWAGRRIQQEEWEQHLQAHLSSGL